MNELNKIPSHLTSAPHVGPKVGPNTICPTCGSINSHRQRWGQWKRLTHWTSSANVGPNVWSRRHDSYNVATVYVFRSRFLHSVYDSKCKLHFTSLSVDPLRVTQTFATSLTYFIIFFKIQKSANGTLVSEARLMPPPSVYLSELGCILSLKYVTN